MTKLKQEWETQGSHHWDKKENLDSDSSPCTENSSSQNSRLGLGLQRLRSSQDSSSDRTSQGNTGMLRSPLHSRGWEKQEC